MPVAPKIISDLIADLPLSLMHGDGGALVTNLTDDSRQVTPGCLFIVRSTTATSGDANPASPASRRTFIEDAIARGAVAILAQRSLIEQTCADRPATSSPLTWIAADNVDQVDQALCGQLAERFYDHPSRQLKVIGITGTNGKTTTAFLIQHLLNQASCKCGLIGTVINDDGVTRHVAELTTPGAIEFSRLLATMVSNGCEAVAAEISSHALHQGRTAAMNVDVAVFTNLTGDHLDYHQTMDNYADAKAILFRSLSPQGFAVVNHDDPYADTMVEGCKASVLRCSVKENVDAELVRCRAQIVALAADHSRVVLDGPWGSVDLRLSLVGKHNIYNALQAVAAANCVRAMARNLREAMANCPAPPGRLEPVRVESVKGHPAVLVDYAHTHDALENVLSTLKPLTRGKLIVIFGCGGDRDKTKRPKMAKVACACAHRVIITSDNPRTEDPQKIIDDIVSGSGSGSSSVGQAEVIVEIDRAKAIALTIAQAGADDVVLIAGKGHEDYQIIGKVKHHFDDREHAAAALLEWREQPMAQAS